MTSIVVKWLLWRGSALAPRIYEGGAPVRTLGWGEYEYK